LRYFQTLNSWKENQARTMEKQQKLFFTFVTDRRNRAYILLAIVISVAYFIALRLLYPIPSFFADSFTYVGAAAKNEPVSFRPVGYSRILQFFKLFSSADIALIAGQYFANITANLFLFFSFIYFFSFQRWLKNLLFILLIANPFYLFYSNYISPDAFFCGFTVLWFTLLIWNLYKPRWYFFVLQLIVLVLLFSQRYNAMILPVIMTFAILLSKQAWWKKALSIAGSYAVIVLMVMMTIKATRNYVGTNTFSAFSGWQLANNALHILRFEKVDSASIESSESRKILAYTNRYFETTTDSIPLTATAWYLWHPASPLKTYMKVFDGRKKTYFLTWNALGPVYNNFGKTIVLKKPVAYLRYFVVPNTKEYFYPKLEIYKTYFEDVDTIATVARKFYNYKTNSNSTHKPALYAAVFAPWRILFPLLNVAFVITLIAYVVKKNYTRETPLFNYTLFCFTLFYLANFLFVVLLAPSVLRYHVFILTLSFPILFYLIQKVWIDDKQPTPSRTKLH
jgi:hypothetical protein